MVPTTYQRKKKRTMERHNDDLVLVGYKCGIIEKSSKRTDEPKESMAGWNKRNAFRLVQLWYSQLARENDLPAVDDDDDDVVVDINDGKINSDHAENQIYIRYLLPHHRHRLVWHEWFEPVYVIRHWFGQPSTKPTAYGLSWTIASAKNTPSPWPCHVFYWNCAYVFLLITFFLSIFLMDVSRCLVCQL